MSNKKWRALEESHFSITGLQSAPFDSSVNAQIKNGGLYRSPTDLFLFDKQMIPVLHLIDRKLNLVGTAELASANTCF
jgi:hypothetical protein